MSSQGAFARLSIPREDSVCPILPLGCTRQPSPDHPAYDTHRADRTQYGRIDFGQWGSALDLFYPSPPHRLGYQCDSIRCDSTFSLFFSLCLLDILLQK